MVSKSQSKIAVDSEQVKHVLTKLGAAHESPGIPTVTSIVVQSPPTAAAVSSFNDGIANYGTSLKVAVTYLREQLQILQDDITQTVNQFVENDAAVADQAEAMLSSIDSGATIPVSNSYTPVSSNPASVDASKSGY